VHRPDARLLRQRPAGTISHSDAERILRTSVRDLFTSAAR
jgi:hypothetical protein